MTIIIMVVIRSFVFLGFAFLALAHPYPAPNVKIAERSATEEAELAEADSVTPLVRRRDDKENGFPPQGWRRDDKENGFPPQGWRRDNKEDSV
ncbi:hypothetical protein BKA59DRAFT_508928 [Fusarium tricinctum]|uniref:Secreted protein n=1 Tax=Fusarium tricinctum TaxID=61284 RepID=A0A8K0S792_9HYPO|nr:hypothetical protein BKA59DRAFT_508928 [Fusarium tricinctum]